MNAMKAPQLYQSMRKKERKPDRKHGRSSQGEVRFLRCVSGNTLGSDDGFIRKLKEGIPGLKEEFNVKNCDFILVFCSVVSGRIMSIRSALQKLQDLSESKTAVLVVLHHTFDPEFFISDSSRSMDRENTLTVDCLFEQDRGLLKCQRNQEALEKVTQWINNPVKGQDDPQMAHLFRLNNQPEPTTDTADAVVSIQYSLILSPC
ncbi:uncharacterized protein LOC125804693 [Astyanax mexicanus]|uniref:uncharacterized protein LOC125804693 n=1 Tax=Astyanax mexicanus TaxID=7994 RepID=UPI0020CAD4FE|nr:uncharacterized protein LOC125804693 [Astyanax mexicanus]